MASSSDNPCPEGQTGLFEVSSRVVIASAGVASLRGKRAQGEVAPQVPPKTEIGGGRNALGAILGRGGQGP